LEERDIVNYFVDVVGGGIHSKPQWSYSGDIQQ